MSLKLEIETWVRALDHYDNNEFEESLKSFDGISDTSKILFNCGVIHATLGEHDKAVSHSPHAIVLEIGMLMVYQIECYQRAVRLDQYLAVAYFQQGVSNFLIGDFEEALANFNDTLLYLRGNTYIDYEQLGLKFKLYSCEVLFNRGLCYIYLEQKEAGMQDFSFAVKEKVVEDHDVIDEAIREQAEGYTVFSIPVGVVYRPNSAKVKNLKTKDYLGKARLVAASERSNAFTDFAGSERKKSIANEDTSRDDRPAEVISFAATNLVKPELRSKVRQQSEPPINRQVFPPTPPPESEKPLSTSSNRSGGSNAPSITGRAMSVRNRLEDLPERLNIQKLNASTEAQDRPRLGTMRTASEPRGPSRTNSNSRDQDFVVRSRTGRNTPFRSRVGSRDDNEYRSRMGSRDDNEYRSRMGSRDDHEGQDQLVDMFQNYRLSSGGKRGDPRSNQRQQYIEEEDEFGSDVYENSSIDENDFEMVSRERPGRKMSSGGTLRRPEVRKIRVKVHFAEDTRYIMIGTAIEYVDFQERIRTKFNIGKRFKCKIRDEEDMITMGDQDDLEMAISTCISQAKRERADMGKMEVSLDILLF
ncbi:MAG: hypothetical protein M1837_005704 [Sclerophora amabilis]|nr:MAG: hypothetical protein M1837_005704 [Sclerophora amabilis]